MRNLSIRCLLLVFALQGCAAGGMPRDRLLEHAETWHYSRNPHHARAQLELMNAMRRISVLSGVHEQAQEDVRPQAAAQLADAYADQGRAYSRMGAALLSFLSYQMAEKLSGGKGEYLADMAIELQLMGETAEAEKLYSQALELQPGKDWIRRSAAFHYLSLAEYAKALALYQPLLADVESPYPRNYLVVSLYLAQRGAGREAEAGAHEKPDAWPAPLLDYMRGTLDAESLLQRLSADPAERQGQLCELYYYLGLWHEIRGARDLARDYYRAATDTHMLAFREYGAAEEGLRRLADWE